VYSLTQFRWCFTQLTWQKIDKLKSQLTMLADLVNSISLDQELDNTAELDEDELRILRNAGVISEPSNRKGKRRKHPPKHIVFVENDEEGACQQPHSRKAAHICTSAEHYTAKKAHDEANGSTSKPDSPVIDLGWKVSTKKKPAKPEVAPATQSVDAKERREQAMVSRHLVQKLVAHQTIFSRNTENDS
jgi:hypothetical protein